MTKQKPEPHLAHVDPVWDSIRVDAEQIAAQESALASFIFSNILSHETLEQAVVARLASRLDHPICLLMLCGVFSHLLLKARKN